MNTSLTNTTASPSKEDSVIYYQPRFVVDRIKDETKVRIEIPGVRKEDVNLTVENKELFLEGRVSSKRPENWKILHRESIDRVYQLRLRLGEQVDKGAIGADLSNGVLTLTLPKEEAAKPHKISVK